MLQSYKKSMLFMGVLTTIGLPDSLKTELEDHFGPILAESVHFPFTFTDYYNSEMGDGIERFFLAFSSLVSPDTLQDAKLFAIALEERYSEKDKRRINLDPGLISEHSVILATTKNRAHRIAIGKGLYAEITLIYQNHGFQDQSWTYADYRSDEVKAILGKFREEYKSIIREQHS